jgi:hypothetical protein
MSNLHQHPSEYLDHISSQAFFLRGRMLAILAVAVSHLMMSVRSRRRSILIGISKQSLAWQMQRRKVKAGVGISMSGSGSPAKNIWMALGQRRIPNDPHLKGLPCPIDQEPFVSFWSDELQEFIWTDAIQIGDRIYHASCYRQAMADRAKAATPIGTTGSARISTPDSVLGKRKAEVGGLIHFSF